MLNQTTQASATKQEYTVLQREQQEQFLLPIATFQATLFGLLASWVYFHPILPVDLVITRALQKKDTPLLRKSVITFSHLNAHHLLNVLTIPMAFLLWKRRLRLEAATIIGATAMTDILREVIHRIVNRPRPDPKLVQVMQDPDGKSFPSGHVLASFTFWSWFLTLKPLIIKEDTWWKRILLKFPIPFIMLIGPARIYLGDHWASDVLGGYLLGSSWFCLSLRLYQRLKSKGVLA